MSKPCSVCGGNCKWVYGPFCEGTARTMAEMDGSRILAPGQLDPYTIERCAEALLDMALLYAECSHERIILTFAAAAIRALAKGLDQK